MKYGWKACPRCGKRFKDYVKRCDECGWIFYNKSCPRCGTYLKDNVKVCPNCGWYFHWEKYIGEDDERHSNNTKRTFSFITHSNDEDFEDYVDYDYHSDWYEFWKGVAECSLGTSLDGISESELADILDGLGYDPCP